MESSSDPANAFDSHNSQRTTHNPEPPAGSLFPALRRGVYSRPAMSRETVVSCELAVGRGFGTQRMQFDPFGQANAFGLSRLATHNSQPDVRESVVSCELAVERGWSIRMESSSDAASAFDSHNSQLTTVSRLATRNGNSQPESNSAAAGSPSQCVNRSGTPRGRARIRGAAVPSSGSILRCHGLPRALRGRSTCLRGGRSRDGR